VVSIDVAVVSTNAMVSTDAMVSTGMHRSALLYATEHSLPLCLSGTLSGARSAPTEGLLHGPRARDVQWGAQWGAHTVGEQR
jgi:hypothetical protein